jgi:hypothetical protein
LIGREPAASVSDARLKHLERFKEAYTPVDEVPEDAYIHVNTDRPLKESMAAILASDYYLLAEQTASVIADRS